MRSPSLSSITTAPTAGDSAVTIVSTAAVPACLEVSRTENTCFVVVLLYQLQIPAFFCFCSGVGGPGGGRRASRGSCEGGSTSTGATAQSTRASRRGLAWWWFC